MQEPKHISKYKKSLKEKILAAAMASFAQKGIKAVKMDDIANQLSISKRTLYEIYNNKEDLLFEGVKRYKEMRQEEILQKTKNSKNVVDILFKIYRIKAEEFRRTNPLFYEDIARYPCIVRFLEDDKASYTSELYKFLQRGIEEGYFRPDTNCELVGHMFEAIGTYMMENHLYQQYSFDEISFNILFVSMRGLCTAKGIEELDRSLEELKE